MVRRLLAHWTSADATARSAGSAWYADARATVRTLARAHSRTERAVAGIVAALSPRVTWRYNVKAAAMLLAGGAPACFRSNLAKARAILNGARPLDALRGPKVRAFYRALVGDERSAVVDVWTVRAAVGRMVNVTERVYRAVSDALARAAEIVGTTTARMQAVAWVVVRGRAS